MHVIQRGHDRKPIFRRPEDRHVAMRYITEALARCKVLLHAYVFMGNHVHLLVTGLEEGSISRFMRDWSRRYSRYFNKSVQRCGCLYDTRFRSFPVIGEQYLLRCMRYIERNPVRARICPHPAQFSWSSFAENRTGEPRPPLTPHGVYLALGRNAIERGRNYDDLLAAIPADSETELFREGIRPRAVGRPRKSQREPAQ